MNTIVFQENREKLLPLALMFIAVDALSIAVAIAHYISSGSVWNGNLADAVAAIFAVPVLAWITGWTVWPLIRPHRVEISPSQLRITAFGRTKTYDWNDLSEPYRAAAKTSTGLSIADFVAFDWNYDSKPLAIRTGYFSESYDTVFDTLMAAKHGRLGSMPRNAGSPLIFTEADARRGGSGWILLARVGTAVMMICFLAILGDLVLKAVAPTSMTTRTAEPADLTLLAPLPLSLIFAFAWSKRRGDGPLAMTLRVPLYVVLSAILMTMGWVITYSKIAELMLFRGKTAIVAEAEHILTVTRSESKQHGRTSVRWDAMAKPLGHSEGDPFIVQVDEDAYRAILAHSKAAPNDSNDAARGESIPWQTTDLCFTANAQRAGKAERIIMNPGQIFTTSDFKPC